MRAALLLDRDGVINVDRDYVCRLEDFEWQPGIFDLARAATRAGWPIVVVTNQSGIGRGYYTEADFQRITAHMRERFVHEAAPLAAVYHAPFHPEAVDPALRAADHAWRKPRPGMILAARDDLRLDLAASILIGDRASDIEAGATAGVGTLVMVGSRPAPQGAQFANVLRFATVADAARALSGAFERSTQGVAP